jgi:putative Mg2+ transporter-C (MgtC) family protein
MNLANWSDLGLLTARLGVAIAVGGIIGWNRQVAHKSAGLRTHMLVSLGSALFVLIPIVLEPSGEGLSRTIQGVATGIGFLGAGEIIRDDRPSRKPSVRGLTSAASIWVTAALGMLAAVGLWQLSLIATGMTLLILVVAKWVEDKTP